MFDKKEIKKLIADYSFADNRTEQAALTDIIMHELELIQIKDLTITKIRETIERELTVWERVKTGEPIKGLRFLK